MIEKIAYVESGSMFIESSESEKVETMPESHETLQGKGFQIRKLAYLVVGALDETDEASAYSPPPVRLSIHPAYTVGVTVNRRVATITSVGPSTRSTP